MRSKWMTLFLVTSCVLVSCVGCQGKESTKEEICEEFQKQVSKVESYTCIAEIIVEGNKGESSYTMKQTYKKTDNYKLEMISPDNLKGQTVEYKNGKVIINNSKINDSIELLNKCKDGQYFFIGDFISNYSQNKKLDMDLSDDYLKLEVQIPGDDEYFNKQKLYVNIKDKSPDKMEIIDKEGNIRFTVKYKNFNYKK